MSRWLVGCTQWPAGWRSTLAARLLAAVAVNVQSRVLARGPISGEFEFLPDHHHPVTDYRGDMERRDLSRVVDEALGQLPEKYRAPVILCYLEGKTNAEAARQLGWPAGSMSRRLERARGLLREKLVHAGVVFVLALLLRRSGHGAEPGRRRRIIAERAFPWGR